MSPAMFGGNWQSNLGSTIASFMLIWALIKQYFPAGLQMYISSKATRFVSLLSPYVHISFPEYTGDRLRRSEAFAAIESYLSASSSDSARRLKAEMGNDSTSLLLTMDEYEEVSDSFQKASLKWSSYSRSLPEQRSYPFPLRQQAPSEGLRYYRLTFHRRYRKLVLDEYLKHVMNEGKDIGVKKRQRKLYTNSSSYDWIDFKRSNWSHVPFEHPASFATLAMDPAKKKEIVEDLIAFSKSKDYYARIGKPWKRGYLLYGPPGTGKSTMVAAMANLLDYDVYDLELTAVKNNTMLRKLLIETTSKSVIVLEDIDCSLDLTGKRKEEDKQSSSSPPPPPPGREDREDSKVTLSGLLNFIDGLWSSCGGERLIVFTTNHIERLDPALIRRGRMDKHVELSYCSYEGFKVLAKNYLNLEDHYLFEKVKKLMQSVTITPADVAECLMPKTVFDDFEKKNEQCLMSLVLALEEIREKAEAEAAAKAAEEEMKKVSEEMKEIDGAPPVSNGEEGKEEAATDSGEGNLC